MIKDKINILLESRLIIDKNSMVVDNLATESLKKVTLKAKNTGTLSSAVISAAFYAKKYNTDMYVYPGSSYMVRLFRVSNKESDYLDPINNQAKKLMVVSPDLTVKSFDLKR
jgi:hypothetical protein